MISIVCVHNNENILNNWLMKSLKNQTSDCELIILDNTQGKFRSAAEALNYGGKQANGKYVMFVHQDVDLYSNTWLEDVEMLLNSIPDFGIAGVAGMSENGTNRKERGRNVIVHGIPPEIWSLGNSIQKPEPVQTLDECLVIIPKSKFNFLQFDEKTCDNWHLYVVDYCLKCIELEFEVVAIPLCIYHMSTGVRKKSLQAFFSLGSLPKSYYKTLDEILKKHKNHFDRVFTTCGDWDTHCPLTLQRIYHLRKGFTNSKNFRLKK